MSRLSKEENKTFEGKLTSLNKCDKGRYAICEPMLHKDSGLVIMKKVSKLFQDNEDHI